MPEIGRVIVGMSLFLRERRGCRLLTRHKRSSKHVVISSRRRIVTLPSYRVTKRTTVADRYSGQGYFYPTFLCFFYTSFNYKTTN